ncbi:major facilitator superfamily domain-containing protein [Aspergillus multicolor]|uniref:putative MFS multidrug transporter n=1 Tax=Aspergillus multicolor TaxID=41759 RepID=UPI003CCCF533
MDPQSKTSDEAASTDVPQDVMDAHCLTGVKLHSVLRGIMIATMLISIDVSIIVTAIPAISSQFNAATDIGWYGAAYPVTMCALQPLSGKISSIFPLRWSYFVFFGIFLLGSVLCAVAGIGGVGIVSGGLSVIALVTPTAQRPLFTGLITSLYAVWTVVAPTIGGAFTTNVSWRCTAVVEQDARILRIMKLDLVCCIIFVGSIMYKDDEALIPLTLFRDRSVDLSILFAFLFMASFVVSVYYLPEWFQIVKGASPMRSGVILLPSVSTQVFGAIVSGHVRYYNPWFFIGSSMLCIASGLYTTFIPSTSSNKWIEFQILQGLGCGFAAQMALVTVQNVLKTQPGIVSVGISTVLFAQYFGSSVMQTVGASIFHNELVRRLESNSGAGLNATGVAMLLDAGTSK